MPADIQMTQELQENRTHKITFRLNNGEVKFLDEFSGRVGIYKRNSPS
ncbi:MAG: hypothetical protein JJU34_18510 [Lunatimonas sp.]|nr:hypothetical protein [Lunatimonas sp.]MCC5939278.1 hypothetical protein [Lunatimonas sp.]